MKKYRCYFKTGLIWIIFYKNTGLYTFIKMKPEHCVLIFWALRGQRFIAIETIEPNTWARATKLNQTNWIKIHIKLRKYVEVKFRIGFEPKKLNVIQCDWIYSVRNLW